MFKKIALLALAALPTASFAMDYQVVDRGTTPAGTEYEVVQCIDDSGNVVGTTNLIYSSMTYGETCDQLFGFTVNNPDIELLGQESIEAAPQQRGRGF